MAYFPEKVEQLAPSSIEVLAPFSGTYALNRYAHDDIGKFGRKNINGHNKMI